jgi:hypothetical protein
MSGGSQTQNDLPHDALVRLLRSSGGPHWFGELYRRYQRRKYCSWRGLFRDAAAEDVTQDLDSEAGCPGMPRDANANNAPGGIETRGAAGRYRWRSLIPVSHQEPREEIASRGHERPGKVKG